LSYSLRLYKFRLINLETLTVLDYFFKVFRLINLENINVLAYKVRDSKCFALLI